MTDHLLVVTRTREGLTGWSVVHEHCERVEGNRGTWHYPGCPVEKIIFVDWKGNLPFDVKGLAPGYYPLEYRNENPYGLTLHGLNRGPSFIRETKRVLCV